MQIDKDIKGIIVTKIENPNTNSEIDDIIIEINREEIINVEDFKDYVIKFKEEGRSSVLLKVIRSGKSFWATIKYIQ